MEKLDWNISGALLAWRAERGLGSRQMAKLVGLSLATYSRLERGFQCDAKTLGTVLRWLLSKEMR